MPHSDCASSHRRPTVVGLHLQLCPAGLPRPLRNSVAATTFATGYTRALPRVLFASLFLVACFDDNGGHWPAHSDGSRATLHEELRIDGNRADLVPLQTLAVARDGSIIAPQGMDSGLRFFDSAGVSLGMVGRRGRGPGEFMNIARVGWIADTLWVLDAILARMTLIATDRRVVRTINIPMTAYLPRADSEQYVFPAATTHGLYSSNDVLALLQGSPSLDTPPGFRNSLVYARLDQHGMVRRLIAWTPAGEGYLRYNGSVLSLPFRNRPAFATSPDSKRIVTVTADIQGQDGGVLSVQMFDWRGDTIFHRTYPFAGVPLPPSVADSTIERRAADLRQRDPEMAAAFRRAANVPPVYPPIRRVLVGPDGTVWIQLIDVPHGRPFFVVGANGDSLGTLTLSPSTTVALAGRDRIWTLEADSLGVESIVRYHVEWK